MAEFVANFNLNNNNLDASFDLSEGASFDALFEIYAGSVTWGNISGDITNQTDLQNALNSKASNERVDGIVEAFDDDIENINDSITELSENLDGLENTVTNNYNELSSSIDSNHQAISNINNTIQTYGDIVTYNASYFATSEQGALADTAVQPNDNISELTNDVGYITSASLPVVNNNRITIQKNGSSVGDFTLNQSNDEAINLIIPTTATDIGALPDTTTINDLTTTAQQEALNSGANTANIGQISANAQAIQTETNNRTNADNNLQSQIDALVASSDVFDIVGTYAELQAYDISTVPVNDIIKVLVDSTHNNAATYYRCVENNNVKSWSYIGSEGAYYTKGEADSTFVPQTRTINGQALSSNINLTASDVGALPDSTVIPTVNNATLTIQKNGANVQTFTANASSNVTANITVPTDTSDLTNGAGFITAASLPTVNNGTLTIQTNGTTVGTFTANQAGNTTANIVVPDSATWGNITGTLSNQTDLQNVLNTKANISSLATVATSGSYNDLSNRPTIGNGTVTFTQDGVTKGTITMNQSGNTTIALEQGGVTDVEVNGESVVTDGVAEIDLSNYQTTIEAGENIRITQPADIRVPEGYTQLERINSTSGACCIDTGLKGAIKWEIDVMGNSPYPTKRALIATDGNGSAFFGQYSGSSAWGTNGSSTGVAISDRINLIINFTTTGCNGTINGTSFSYNAAGDLSTNWVLFGTSTYGTRLYGYLYSAKATQNGLVVFDGVPAVRDSDHVAGLYDVVSGNFFTSATTTEFSAGSVLSTNTVVSANVGNGTLTISRYGTTLATFTANQTGNTTANMTNPAIQPKEIGASSILNSSTTKAINSLLYCGNDNLVHSYTETNVPISMAYGMFVNSSQLTANSSISYYYRGEKLGWSVPSAMRIFTARHKVWARCTYPDSSGNVYFVSLYDQNGSVNTLQGGYTYYYLGCASSTSTIALDVTGSHFLSINTDGKLTHIDGVEVKTSSIIVDQTYDGTSANPQSGVAIEGELASYAKNDLSNLTTTSSTNFDGQWVHSDLAIHSASTIGSRSYSLASYLPNDSYSYEVMVRLYAAGSSTAGFAIGDIASPYTNITSGFCCTITVGSNYRAANGVFIIPIGTDRTIYTEVVSNDLTTGLARAIGYRRIGTNS